MADIIIRRATPADDDALSRICLLTADAGASAAALHDHPALPGLFYALPYLHLPTSFGFVLENETTHTVVGYVVASSDTRAFESAAAETWWPSFWDKYPLSLLEAPIKEADARYIRLLRNMHVASEANIAFAPAHLHINILPEYQKQGWGRRLIGRVVEELRGQGGDSVWLGLDNRNVGARRFYERLGFVQIVGADEGNMGLRLENWK